MTPMLALLLAVSLEAPVDLSKYNASSGIRIERQGGLLRAEWPADADKSCAAVFSLDAAKPLFASFEVGGVVVARDVRPVFTVTTGSRTERANERYI